MLNPARDQVRYPLLPELSPQTQFPFLVYSRLTPMPPGYPSTSRSIPAMSWRLSGRALPQPQWNNSRSPTQAHPSSQPPLYSSTSMANDTFLPPIRESTGQSTFTSQRIYTGVSYPQYQGAFQSNEDRHFKNTSPFNHNLLQSSCSRAPAENNGRNAAPVTNCPPKDAPPALINSASPHIHPKHDGLQQTTPTNRTSEQTADKIGANASNISSCSDVEVSNSSLPSDQQSHIFVSFNFANSTNSKVQIERQGKRRAPDHDSIVARKRTKAKSVPSKRTKAKEVDPNSVSPVLTLPHDHCD